MTLKLLNAPLTQIHVGEQNLEKAWCAKAGTSAAILLEGL
jgi:hypothetical protein